MDPQAPDAGPGTQHARRGRGDIPVVHGSVSYTHLDVYKRQVLARALLTLAEREGARAIVGGGAGRGELLTALRSLEAGMPLTGLDVVDRPSDLDDSITWLRSPGGAELPDELAGLSDTLVIAHEWLDVVPCEIAEVDDSGTLRQVVVDLSTGQERLGDPLVGPELSWALAHWPAGIPGERVEIGLARDVALSLIHI